MSSTFPYFEASGDAEALGAIIGKLTAERVKANYNFYQDLFAEIFKTDATDTTLLKLIREYSEQYSLVIKREFPNYAVEIEALAKSADLPAWQIYALNSRTEIYRLLAEAVAKKSPGECTALYFPKSKILGQNWDWHPKSEELSIVTKLSKADGSSILMLTEPGIIGKIGINSQGLGVCLNILFGNCSDSAVPIHIILRAVLDSTSVAEAVKKIEELPRGTSSNLLLADKSGAAVDLEMLGTEIRNVSLDGGELIHTNHYLDDESSASAALPGSVYRLKRAKDLLDKHEPSGLTGMQALLSDHEHPDYPICRGYGKGLDFLIGTVASVIIDLNSTSLYLARGQSARAGDWKKYSLG